jgi:hypothetical protein
MCLMSLQWLGPGGLCPSVTVFLQSLPSPTAHVALGFGGNVAAAVATVLQLAQRACCLGTRVAAVVRVLGLWLQPLS